MKKCPYLSTRLECFAGHTGSAHCMRESFHNSCEFKARAQSRLRILNNENS